MGWELDMRELVLTAPSKDDDTYELARLDTVEHVVRRQFEDDVRDVENCMWLSLCLFVDKYGVCEKL